MNGDHASSSSRLNRVVGHLAIGLLLSFGLLAIILSPYLLVAVGDHPADWEKISDIGQAYGGISAILSGFALIAVTVSLLFQRRQIAADRAYADRQRHFELVKMAFEDPSLIQVVEHDLSAEPDARERMYANMWMGFWHASWSHGGMSDDALSYHLGEMFKSPTAWRWWAQVGPIWRLSGSRRDRAFLELAMRAWHSVPPPLIEGSGHRPANAVDNEGAASPHS